VVYILITLIFTKVIHELGHAYACKLYDCKVNDMGVTFIFFYPLFYTNVSKSILLSSDKRIIISTAGLRWEFYLAVISGLLWFIVSPDSSFKNILFFVASVSWLISLFVNLMPFIKFDGYYILSDHLNIRNLGPRATAVFKYYFRRKVFGIDSDYPERYDKEKYKFLLTFAILTGLYKVFLFTTIFLFLYYIEFIGIVLFSLAMIVLIMMPLSKELYNIYLLRKKIVTYKSLLVSSIVASLLIAIFIMPMGSNVYIPAVYSAKIQRLYSPVTAQVKDINLLLDNSQANKILFVNKNQKLLVLSSHELQKDIEINKINKATSEFLVQESKLSSEKRVQLQTKVSEVNYFKAIEKSLIKKKQQLSVAAPISGRVTAIYDNLDTNIWLAEGSWLLDIVDYNQAGVQGYVSVSDLRRLDPSSGNIVSNNSISKKSNAEIKSFFIPDNVNYAACEVKIKAVASDPIDKITQESFVAFSIPDSKIVLSNLLLFSSLYGGSINFEEDEDKNLIPVDSYFIVDFTSTSCNYLKKDKGNKINNINHVIKGVVKIAGPRQSLFNRFVDLVKDNFA